MCTRAQFTDRHVPSPLHFAPTLPAPLPPVLSCTSSAVGRAIRACRVGRMGKVGKVGRGLGGQVISNVRTRLRLPVEVEDEAVGQQGAHAVHEAVVEGLLAGGSRGY